VSIPGTAFSAETAGVVRVRLGEAIPEMIEAIAAGVPGDAGRARPDYKQRLADAVTGAVACFIAHVAGPDQSTKAIMTEFRAIGGAAAREGRTLDALQDAVRYRMRQIHELFGDQLRDQDRRFELQLALRIRTLSASACQAKTPGRRGG